MSEVTHEFGSQATELKLSVVEAYLRAYTTALKKKFQLCYFDMFAGMGSRTVRTSAREGDLVDKPAPEIIETRRGSAQIALDIQPEFDRVVFAEKNSKYCEELRVLAAKYPTRTIEVREGDANEIIREEMKFLSVHQTRGVMFIDPYGMNVDWETLTSVGRTGAIDVWYLFSLSGLYRQAARDIRNIDENKRKALTRMLGTTGWEKELYSKETQTSLFGKEESYRRIADVRSLENYVKRRLETIFTEVLPPLALPIDKKPQMFSLFFAISSHNHKARALAKRIANHILNSGNSSHVLPR